MNVIRTSWDRDPSSRPSFEIIARELKKQRAEWSAQGLNSPMFDSPQPTPLVAEWDAQNPHHHAHHSPDILPRPLPGDVDVDVVVTPEAPTSGLGLDTGEDDAISLSSMEELSGFVSLSQPAVARPAADAKSLTSDASIDLNQSILASGYLTPLHPDDLAAKCQNERRYRMLLQHDYHTIRACLSIYNFPCYVTDDPKSHAPAVAAVSCRTRRGGVPVETGRPIRDVVQCVRPWGVLRRQGGRAADVVRIRQGFPGQPTTGQAECCAARSRSRPRVIYIRVRTTTALPLPPLSPLYLPRTENRRISRTQSFQLRALHKVAYIYAESTMYRYITNVDVPKKWFQSNIDHIMKIYGREQRLTREDIFLGTLRVSI